MEKVTAVAFLSSLILLSCRSAPKPEPSVQEVFERSRTVSHAEASRRPWAAGQWVLLRMTTETSERMFGLFGSEERSYRTIGITRMEGDAFWLEQRRVTEDGEEWIALLVEDEPDAKSFQPRRVSRLVVENDGEVAEYAGEKLESSQAREVLDGLQGLYYSFHASKRGGRRRDVTVPAGTFETEATFLAQASTLGRLAGSICFSDAVPVIHYALADLTATSGKWFNTRTLEELVDFGYEGVESHFFQE